MAFQDTHSLMLQACHDLIWNQKDVARIIGVSTRTLQRRNSLLPVLGTPEADRFIKGVHARNPRLAAQIAASAGTTLVALGLEAAPPPPAPPAPRPAPVARREHADAVVAAAADALNLIPRDARPVVAAIFTRISDLDVDLPGLVKLLKDAGAAADKPPSKK